MENDVWSLSNKQQGIENGLRSNVAFPDLTRTEVRTSIPITSHRGSSVGYFYNSRLTKNVIELPQSRCPEADDSVDELWISTLAKESKGKRIRKAKFIHSAPSTSQKTDDDPI